MAPANREMGASTRALHVDDALNVVTDVAPPIHVATTFRYSDNPDDLVPWADRSGVGVLLPECTPSSMLTVLPCLGSEGQHSSRLFSVDRP